MAESTATTLTSLTNTFTAFLTVCIHTILRNRCIYPAESFLTTRAYNFPVAQSRHPKVCQWINDAVAAVEAQMLRANDLTGETGGWVEKVVLVIFSEQSEVMERYVFDISKFPRVPAKEIDTDLVREQAHNTSKSTTRARPQLSSNATSEIDVDLSEQFRATLSHISQLGSKVSPLPKNCTFSLAIELSDPADPPVGHPQPWIPTQPDLQRNVGENNKLQGNANNQANGGESTAPADLADVKIVPVSKVDAGETIFEMWVEEGKDKALALAKENISQSRTAEKPAESG